MMICDAIFMDRQSGQKLVFAWESDGKSLFAKSNLTQIVNRTFKILGVRLYSNLKDASWLEDTQLIFLIFHTFISTYGWVDAHSGCAVPPQNFRLTKS